MNALLTKAFLAFNDVKVVHSLPGRVRLSVPGLKMVPEEFLYLEEELCSIFQTIKGINSFELSPYSGRALIHFDTELFTERELMDWLRDIWQELASVFVAIDKSLADERIISEMKKTLIEKIQSPMRIKD
ncbi:MAG: hypothetical protein PQJ50_05665 [Spirochaetales bacterium]|nr:hypothetical protein [Spirochaetales bacterium]